MGSRRAYNTIALAMIGDHPMGVGLDNYVMAVSLDPHYRRMLAQYPSYRVHNAYLEVLTETGWVGLFAFLVVGLRFLLHAWRGATHGTAPLLCAGIVIAYVGVAVYSTMEYILLEPPVLFVVLTLAALDGTHKQALASP
jgi:O-antigen ligase